MREEKKDMIWVKYIGRKPRVSQSYNHIKYSWDENTPNGITELIPMGLYKELIIQFPNDFLPVPSPESEKELDQEEEILDTMAHKKKIGRPRK